MEIMRRLASQPRRNDEDKFNEIMWTILDLEHLLQKVDQQYTLQGEQYLKNVRAAKIPWQDVILKCCCKLQAKGRVAMDMLAEYICSNAVAMSVVLGAIWQATSKNAQEGRRLSCALALSVSDCIASRYAGNFDKEDYISNSSTGGYNASHGVLEAEKYAFLATLRNMKMLIDLVCIGVSYKYDLKHMWKDMERCISWLNKNSVHSSSSAQTCEVARLEWFLNNAKDGSRSLRNNVDICSPESTTSVLGNRRRPEGGGPFTRPQQAAQIPQYRHAASIRQAYEVPEDHGASASDIGSHPLPEAASGSVLRKTGGDPLPEQSQHLNDDALKKQMLVNLVLEKQANRSRDAGIDANQVRSTPEMHAPNVGGAVPAQIQLQSDEEMEDADAQPIASVRLEECQNPELYSLDELRFKA